MAEQTPRIGLPYPSKEDDPWFDGFVALVLALDATGFAAREDRHFIMGEGGTVAWDLGTETLSWGSEFFITGNMTGFRWRVDTGSIVLSEGEVLYVDLNRNPLTNVFLAAQKSNTVPNTNQALALALRLNDKIYWRTGLVLGDGESAPSIAPSGGGGGGTGGLSPIHFVQNGPIAALSPPTDFVDGLREVGLSASVSAVILSQEIDGSAGSTEIELYKVDTNGVETQITTASTVVLASGGGDKARVLTASFIGTNNELISTDRLGIKIVAVQSGAAADVTVTVILAGASAGPPVSLPEDNEVTAAINETVLGTTPVLVGSIYLPAGTIVSADSRVMLGTDQVADTATLEIRRFTGGAIVSTITATGIPQEAQPPSDFVSVGDWYDFYLYADVGTTNAILLGYKFVYTLGAGTRIRQAINETQTGTTPLQVGSVYLPAGTLQAASRCLMGTTGGGTASLELRRFTGGALITTFNVTGAIADQVLGSGVTIPADDWYDLYLFGDAAPTVAVVKGLDWTVLT